MSAWMEDHLLECSQNKTLEIPAGAKAFLALIGVILVILDKERTSHKTSLCLFDVKDNKPFQRLRKSLVIHGLARRRISSLRLRVKSDAALPKAQTTPKFDSYFECHGEVCDRTVDYPCPIWRFRSTIA